MIKNTIDFFLNHLILFALLSIILILIIYEELKGISNEFKILSIQEAILLINRKNALIFDFRTKIEFENEHIPLSKNIPIHNFSNVPLKLNKNYPILILSEVNQYNIIYRKLKSLGFKEIYIIKDGINSWKKLQLPTHKN